VPIDADALAESVAKLFSVDGAGIMLLSEGGVVRYVAASDKPGQVARQVLRGERLTG